jgi:hypothetical protein
MQVRARRSSRSTDFRNQLPTLDGLPYLDEKLSSMGILCRKTINMFNLHKLAIGTIGLRMGYHAITSS